MVNLDGIWHFPSACLPEMAQWPAMDTATGLEGICIENKLTVNLQ